MKKEFKQFLISQNQYETYKAMSHTEKDVVEDVFNWQNKQLTGLKELFFESWSNMSIIQIAKAMHQDLKEGVINGRICEGNTDFEYWLCVDSFMTTFNRVIKKYV